MTAAAVIAAAFAALFAGHYVGDHLLQTDAWAGVKSATKPAEWVPAMAWHLATYHAAVAAAFGGLALAGVPLSWPHVAAALAWSALSHGFIDRRWPVRRLLERTGSAEFARMTTPICGGYLADQALHVACLFVAALIVGAGAA